MSTARPYRRRRRKSGDRLLKSASAAPEGGDGREERGGNRDRGLAGEAEHPRQADRAGRRDVHRAAEGIPDRRHQRLEAIAHVDELEPRVEAEICRHGRQAEVPRDLRVRPRADRRLIAEHHARDLRVAARVGLEVVLDLADVALEPGPERIEPRHLLGEELRRLRLRAVDAGRAADDDRPDGRRALAGAEQLERADHVDVVHRLRRHAGPGPPHDLVVHDRVDLGLRQELRDDRVAEVGLQELGPLELRPRRPGVEAGDVLDLGVAFEPAGQLRAEVAADPGDQDAPAGHVSVIATNGSRATG